MVIGQPMLVQELVQENLDGMWKLFLTVAFCQVLGDLSRIVWNLLLLPKLLVVLLGLQF